MLHLRGGRAAISRDAYPDMEAFWHDAAAAYREAIDVVRTLLADPGRGALARWASGLQSVGVVPKMAASGFGIRYPEALAELRRRS
jgi:hypothetical protein